ncbi:MAG: invasion associated locus B family protein [Methylovirgula sp.]
MLRPVFWILPVLFTLLCGAAGLTPALAAPHKPPPKKAGGEETKAKPVQIGTFGDWGVFLAEAGKEKTCYALAQPKERDPAKLKRDPAYVFISTRPSENIRNEVSIIMGFQMKDGGDAEADVGDASFDLVSKGKNAWVKNVAKEAEMIEAMKKGAKLIVKAPSIKGKVTTDSYSLAGLSQALDKVKKECR